MEREEKNFNFSSLSRGISDGSEREKISFFLFHFHLFMFLFPSDLLKNEFGNYLGGQKRERKNFIFSFSLSLGLGV